MKTIQCDRCSVLRTEENKEVDEKGWWTWQAYDTSGNDGPYAEYDLCQSCDSEFEKWMREKSDE